jgi:folate-dependent tRNA-U54 methylase TrmFO/GidA
MQLNIDCDSGFTLNEETTSLPGVLVEISEHLRELDRSILKIVVDGVDIPPEDLTAIIGDKTTDDVRTVEIQSEDNVKLAMDSIQEIAEVLPELPAACQSLAEVFQTETSEEGVEKFDELAQIWTIIKLRQEQIASSLRFDMESLRINEKTLTECATEVTDLLARAYEVVEAADIAALSDILAYELAPLAEREAEIIALFQAELDKS